VWGRDGPWWLVRRGARRLEERPRRRARIEELAGAGAGALVGRDGVPETLPAAAGHTRTPASLLIPRTEGGATGPAGGRRRDGGSARAGDRQNDCRPVARFGQGVARHGGRRRTRPGWKAGVIAEARPRAGPLHGLRRCEWGRVRGAGARGRAYQRAARRNVAVPMEEPSASPTTYRGPRKEGRGQRSARQNVWARALQVDRRTSIYFLRVPAYTGRRTGTVPQGRREFCRGDVSAGADPPVSTPRRIRRRGHHAAARMLAPAPWSGHGRGPSPTFAVRPNDLVCNGHRRSTSRPLAAGWFVGGWFVGGWFP